MLSTHFHYKEINSIFQDWNELFIQKEAARIQRIYVNLTITATLVTKEAYIKWKPRCEISPQRDQFICQNGQKSYFKQFPGAEKAHRNSIEITVDLWFEWQGSNLRPDGPKPPALPTALHPDMKFHNSRKIKFNTFFRNAQRFSTLQFWGVCGML